MRARPGQRQPKAVALISGGLDSMLAARLILEQGVHVEGLNFFTGFCVEGHTHAIRSSKRERPRRNNALWVAEQLGIKLHIIDVIEDYKAVVLNPRHGYGANLNPCLDCKGFMVGKAREWMEEHEFDFIITGEVIGQRPKSQTREKLPIVQRESGALDRLLRPLCAKALEPTLPEREGWVDREALGDIRGRSRRVQMEMADRFDITEYAQPAGGCCFLTDGNYSAKLRDLWAHRESRDYDLDDIMLLKVGRHIRPNDRFKLIVARDAGETNYLQGYRNRFTQLMAESHSGPLALVQGEPEGEDFETAARITARYGQGRDAEQVAVRVRGTDGVEQVLHVAPFPQDEIPEQWHV
jgi:tRNA U34 2-thiouridine synthase MnmA/TrmU